VFGIDDHEMASVVDLTTVAQPVPDQGAAASRLLLDILDGRSVEPVDVVVPTRLVVRGTTGAPFSRAPDG
jgi:LacI family repressor for deo operon, udp, cdd, tsx, nupC, and nupG